MAQQYTVQYIDDIDGTELGDAAVTLEFSFEGRDYTIDLSEDNAEAFREAMRPYVDNATRVTGGAKSGRRTRRSGGRPSAAMSQEESRVIREWARENGHEVSDRGRISSQVLEAYQKAN